MQHSKFKTQNSKPKIQNSKFKIQHSKFMATLLSSPSMQVTFSFLRKVICEPMQPHGDAAQLAANAGRKVTREPWQRNLFKRTKRDAHTNTHKRTRKNNKHRTCEAWLSKTALESHEDANTCLDKSYIYALAQIRTYMIARTHIDTHIHRQVTSPPPPSPLIRSDEDKMR